MCLLDGGDFFKKNILLTKCFNYEKFNFTGHDYTGISGMNAQTVKGEGSLMGNVGYQTNYERFGLGVQGRYAIANNLRIAPDVTFYFPKDKITGLDVNVNFHYVFNFKEDGQGFSVYPLAGIGMQNNF